MSVIPNRGIRLPAECPGHGGAGILPDACYTVPALVYLFAILLAAFHLRRGPMLFMAALVVECEPGIGFRLLAPA